MARELTQEEQEERATEARVWGRILDREVRSLPCKLTQDELLIASSAIGKAIRDRRDAEDELDTIKKDFKHRIDAIGVSIEILGRMLDTRSEDRSVTVLTRVNPETGMAETVRCDTQEILHSRPLTENERQEEFRLHTRRD